MSLHNDYREYLSAIAGGIDALVTGSNRLESDADGANELAAAGLVRWSGAPNNTGWTPTGEGTRIVSRFHRKKIQ